MDELRVGTGGGTGRRPAAPELLTLGAGRRRETRSHYYSCKGKWELSVRMSPCVMRGYLQGAVGIRPGDG